MEEIRKYPVGMQTFSKIREGNYVYVDKTKYIVHMDPAGLVNELEGKLCQLENIYGTEDWAKGTNQRLECLVKRAYAQTGQKVVLLIDEYDAPLLDVVHEKENSESCSLLV